MQSAAPIRDTLTQRNAGQRPMHRLRGMSWTTPTQLRTADARGAKTPASSMALAIAGSLALAGCVVGPPVVYETHVPAPVSAPVPAAAPTAPPMYFYPERGQVAARQDRDRYECYRWAVTQSGIDPGMTPVTLPPSAPPPPVVRDGSEVAAGAVTGAVVGAIASGPHHSGSGAVLGAIFGAAIGAMAQESRAQAMEQAQAAREQRAQAQRQAEMVPLDNFRRAMSACMAGRGYRVG
jgi:Glycine zipper